MDVLEELPADNVNEDPLTKFEELMRSSAKLNVCSIVDYVRMICHLSWAPLNVSVLMSSIFR